MSALDRMLDLDTPTPQELWRAIYLGGDDDAPVIIETRDDKG